MSCIHEALTWDLIPAPAAAMTDAPILCPRRASDSLILRQDERGKHPPRSRQKRGTLLNMNVAQHKRPQEKQCGVFLFCAIFTPTSALQLNSAGQELYSELKSRPMRSLQRRTISHSFPIVAGLRTYPEEKHWCCSARLHTRTFRKQLFMFASFLIVQQENK